MASAGEPKKSFAILLEMAISEGDFNAVAALPSSNG